MGGKECKCGSKYIVNKKYNLCDSCNYLRLHRESRFEAQIRKQRAKPVKIYRFPNKSLKKRKKQLKKVKKPTGEYKVFLEIWNEREHRCVNCKQGLDRYICRETGNPSAMLFSHMKSKGSRGDLRLLKSNIECSLKGQIFLKICLTDF